MPVDTKKVEGTLDDKNGKTADSVRALYPTINGERFWILFFEQAQESKDTYELTVTRTKGDGTKEKTKPALVKIKKRKQKFGPQIVFPANHATITNSIVVATGSSDDEVHDLVGTLSGEEGGTVMQPSSGLGGVWWVMFTDVEDGDYPL